MLAELERLLCPERFIAYRGPGALTAEEQGEAS